MNAERKRKQLNDLFSNKFNAKTTQRMNENESTKKIEELWVQSPDLLALSRIYVCLSLALHDGSS